ncbi:hypothetical protein MXD81_49260 [Microbacteriaceae bacterium K1510]|nr:hypothetical protein [Microbacteriaceae bacterium K1510]
MFIEVLAALALTAAFVVVVLPFAGRLVERWAAGDRLVQNADAWMRASARLSADLAEAVPLSAPVDRQERLFFRASRRSIVFVKPARSGMDAPLQINAYVIETGSRGDTLVHYATTFSPALIDADPRAFETATAVLTGPLRLSFVSVGADGNRVAEWSNPKEMPVRVELVFASIDRSAVPAAPLVLPIAARAAATASANAGKTTQPAP